MRWKIFSAGSDTASRRLRQHQPISRQRRLRPRLEIMEERITPTTLLPGFTETTLATGLAGATTMEFDPNGRLFVLEQTGAVEYVRSDGTVWTAAQLKVDSNGERGLGGIAFDPNFAQNHYVYLYYTNPKAGAAPWATGTHNQISRFTVDDSDPQKPVFKDEAPILDLNTLGAWAHNGGAIHFGKDGMLYANTGDNEQTFTQNGNTYRISQSLSSLLGKQLRIDVSAFNSGLATRDDTTVGHLIPENNPFVGKATGINQLINVLGLRNPFSFAVQPGTGTMYINDVGESTWEEINEVVPGGNFGWSGGNTDGFGQTPPGPGTYRNPVLAYNHSNGPAGGGSAVVGGTFYNPATVQFPSSYVGKYFYSDLGAGWIRVFDPAHPGTAANPDTSAPFISDDGGNVRDLAVDKVGNLDYITGDGTIYVVSYQAPHITSQPATQTVNAGQSITFSVTATGPSLNYQWEQRVDSQWINVGTNSPHLTITNVTPDDAGSYRVLVSNLFSSTLSDTAALVVNAPNQPPKIVSQPGNYLRVAGTGVSFAVTVSGTLPLTYQWQQLAGTSWENVGTNSAVYTIASVDASDAGSYRVIVSNALGSTTSETRTLTVDQPPTVKIVSPTLGTTYYWGEAIGFSGTASDDDDGVLDPTHFSWTIRFYHEHDPDGDGLHYHPFQTFPGTTNGLFVANFPETSPYVWYRISLTATDSDGASTTTFVDIHPRLTKLTFWSDPPGLQLMLDGGPIASGTSILGTVGQPRIVGVQTPQQSGSTTENFSSWTDNGAASHTIITQGVDVTYIARFAPFAPPPAAATNNLLPGLTAAFFDQRRGLRAQPNFANQVPTVTRTDANIAYPLTRKPWPGLDNHFASTFAALETGYLYVPTTGRYTIYLASTAGSKLWLDGHIVANNDGVHAMRTRSASLNLSSGMHLIQVSYFDNAAPSGLVLSWAGPNTPKQVIPAANFYHGPAGSQPSAAPFAPIRTPPHRAPARARLNHR